MALRFAAVAVGLAADRTVPRQIGQHLLQRHSLLALDPRELTLSTPTPSPPLAFDLQCNDKMNTV
jgi:hypothetical protein